MVFFFLRPKDGLREKSRTPFHQVLSSVSPPAFSPPASEGAPGAPLRQPREPFRKKADPSAQSVPRTLQPWVVTWGEY